MKEQFSILLCLDASVLGQVLVFLDFSDLVAMELVSSTLFYRSLCIAWKAHILCNYSSPFLGLRKSIVAFFEERNIDLNLNERCFSFSESTSNIARLQLPLYKLAYKACLTGYLQFDQGLVGNIEGSVILIPKETKLAIFREIMRPGFQFLVLNVSQPNPFDHQFLRICVSDVFNSSKVSSEGELNSDLQRLVKILTKQFSVVPCCVILKHNARDEHGRPKELIIPIIWTPPGSQSRVHRIFYAFLERCSKNLELPLNSKRFNAVDLQNIGKLSSIVH